MKKQKFERKKKEKGAHLNMFNIFVIFGMLPTKGRLL